MVGQVESTALIGIDGILVKVEADYGEGFPQFEMVGFLASEVKEAKERVRTALKKFRSGVALREVYDQFVSSGFSQSRELF